MVEANPALSRLKTRARLLHQRARARDLGALARLSRHPLLRGPEGPRAQDIQRKHCLDVIAREFGFRGWQHTTRVLGGDLEERDVGTLLCPPACAGFTNTWFARHEDARAHLRDGYLLGYRTHAFIVSAAYIEAMGLDPVHEDWDALARDWLRPPAPAARARLYARLIALRPPEGAPIACACA
ncbi:MAG: hypothetical protein H6713_25835 [Myxococcales bacterium]|nr:hypothetical protein [Myxococcales bacterium]MCB9753376.1 hypothetical protein [Myxococcales bacterium]